MSPRPLPVHHLAVTMRDLAEGERFYGRILGLPEQRRWLDAEGALRSIWFDLGGGSFLAVEKTDAPAPPPGDAPGFHCVALGIAAEERERWRARLAESAVPIERESDFTLYFRDPEHNLLGLSHYPTPRDRSQG
ncbi:MAG: VOC family protein [Byssovorax sp.]